jgi:putative transposase
MLPDSIESLTKKFLSPGMWTEAARKRHAPRKERYPSDLTDAEWALIEPMIPPAQRGGRKRKTDMREAMSAVRYVLRTGCQWRQLPKVFPPRSTVYSYFWEWTRYGVLDRILMRWFKLIRRRWVVERTFSWTGYMNF